MRKNNTKLPKMDENFPSAFGSGRRFSSLSDSLQIPVFVTVDDEEYFFEVEDV